MLVIVHQRQIWHTVHVIAQRTPRCPARRRDNDKETHACIPNGRQALLF
jgi:hypothetical protein